MWDESEYLLFAAISSPALQVVMLRVSHGSLKRQVGSQGPTLSGTLPSPFKYRIFASRILFRIFSVAYRPTHDIVASNMRLVPAGAVSQHPIPIRRDENQW